MSSRKIVFAGMLAALSLIMGAGFDGASAYTLKTLHVFCTNSQCPDGWGSFGAPVAGKNGALFGVTQLGGNDQNAGTIYMLKQKHGNWEFSTVYDFCSKNGCLDGDEPFSALIADVSGNLYGTASSGGRYGKGIVFEFSMKSKGAGRLKVLHNFCADTNCSDGLSPFGTFAYAGMESGRPYDGVSPLYGVASANGAGIVYALTPGKSWKQTVIYTFCQAAGCADGVSPSNVIMDPNGNLFGEAHSYSSTNEPNLGTVFEISPVEGGQWSETTLYQFCTHSEAGCRDGTSGNGPMVMDAAGNLYDGGGDGRPGNNCPETYGCGTLFEIAPNGANSTESVLHYFCQRTDCRDGMDAPTLAADRAGNIFGETYEGGGNDQAFYGRGGGTIFQYTGGGVQTLYAFCALDNCADGAQPMRGLTIDAAGDIFGATYSGGTGVAGRGTIFELVP
jgi:uncharacterized repeat protein (TIGR03803 family)